MAAEPGPLPPALSHLFLAELPPEMAESLAALGRAMGGSVAQSLGPTTARPEAVQDPAAVLRRRLAAVVAELTTVADWLHRQAELAALLTPATARTLPPAERLAHHATDLAATAHALEAALEGGAAPEPNPPSS